jgi:hypothetical protein
LPMVTTLMPSPCKTSTKHQASGRYRSLSWYALHQQL